VETGGDRPGPIAKRSDRPRKEKEKPDEKKDEDDSRKNSRPEEKKEPADDRSGDSEKRDTRKRHKNDTSKIYVVKAGDTLSEIAERELGSSRLWKGILLANLDQIRQPHHIRVGMKLKMPQKVLPPEDRPRRPDGTYDPSPGTPSRPAGGTYVVKAGDSFSRIARDKYGTGALWQVLWKANKDRLGLSTPEQLRVGQKLVVPQLVAIEREIESETETARAP
jgi:nucleoid-associated protein YgaU